MIMKFRIIIEQDEDGIFVVHCPNLPGCISQLIGRAAHAVAAGGGHGPPYDAEISYHYPGQRRGCHG